MPCLPQRPIASVLMLCFLAQTSNALLELPTSIRAYSQFLQSFPGEPDRLYDIEEFVDNRQGNVRIELIDYNEHKQGGLPNSAYFRLRESGQAASGPDDDSVLVYRKDDRVCMLEHLNEWPLNKLSQFITAANSNNNNLTPIVDPTIQRVSIGPLALLRLVQNNAEQFKLDSVGFDQINLAKNYYFATQLIDLDPDENLFDGLKNQIRLAVALPARFTNSSLISGGHDDDDDDDKKTLIGSSLLSQVETKEQVSLIGVFRASTKEQIDILRSLNSSELLNKLESRVSQLDRLMVLFHLVQDYATSGHLGHSSWAFRESVAANPFSLPPAAGCGLLRPSVKPLYIAARQFSGRFEAFAYSDLFYVAFDEASGHLRYDSLGEFRMVHSLSQRVVTTIATNGLRQTAGEAQPHQQSEHCAQINLARRDLHSLVDRSFAALSRAPSMENLLGLGPNVALGFLGRQTLDDDLRCLVYEREVTLSRVPTLLLMHSRANLPREARYILTFYFVSHEDGDADEGGRREANQAAQSEEPDSLWLRRVTLHSYGDSNYAHPESELTFDEFSWSLSVLEGEQEEELHPARVFDMTECSVQSDQIRLEFELEQTNSSKWRFTESDQPARAEFAGQLTDQLEQRLAASLASKIDVPRSHVNQITVNMEEQGDHLMAAFTLIKPSHFEYGALLAGWVLQVDEVLNDFPPEGGTKTDRLAPAVLIKHKRSMSIHECASRVALELGPQHISHMLLCPNVGCGYVRGYKWREVKYVPLSEDKPSIESFMRMCSIFVLNRQLTGAGLVPTSYSDEKLRAKLDNKLVQIQLNKSAFVAAETKLFEARIANLTLRSNFNHQLWDKELKPGRCFSVNTKLEWNPSYVKDKGLDAELAKLNQNVKIIQLEFDKHHSLRQCHQACLQSAFCRTYTYNSQTHQCTLASFDQMLVGGEKAQFVLEGVFEDQKYCRMFALDQARRYKRKHIALVMQPSELMERSWPLFVVDLSTCARLCHQKELITGLRSNAKSRSARCLSFIFMPSHSLCHLWAGDSDGSRAHNLDLSSVEYEFDSSEKLIQLVGGEHGQLKRLAELRDYVGEKLCNESGHFQLFERDYAQHFVIKNNIRLNLVDAVNNSAQEMEDLVPVSVRRSYNSMRFEDCSRECMIVDEDCYAFDFYVEPVRLAQARLDHRAICNLHHFRSPFSFSEQLINFDQQRFALDPEAKLAEDSIYSGLPLSPQEARLYSAEPKKYTVGTRPSTGWHCYLSGDQLYLKRLLARAANNHLLSDGDKPQSTEKPAIEETNDSGTILDPPGSSNDDQASSLFTKMRHFSVSLTFSIGFSCGLLLFVTANSLDLGGPEMSSWWLRRTKRSMSRVELNEMVDI